MGFLFCQKDYDRSKKDFYEYVALAFWVTVASVAWILSDWNLASVRKCWQNVKGFLRIHCISSPAAMLCFELGCLACLCGYHTDSFAVWQMNFSRVGFLFCQKDYDRRKKDYSVSVALAFRLPSPLGLDFIRLEFSFCPKDSVED